MQKRNQKIMEKELQKALAIEYVKNFCVEHNLSLQKLKAQRFILVGNECAFAQPSDMKPNGLISVC